MKDRRLQDYRVALDVLVRVARWTGAEARREPLHTAVQKLPERRDDASDFEHDISEATAS